MPRPRLAPTLVSDDSQLATDLTLMSLAALAPVSTLDDSAGTTALDLAKCMHADSVHLWNRLWREAGENYDFPLRYMIEHVQCALSDIIESCTAAPAGKLPTAFLKSPAPVDTGRYHGPHHPIATMYLIAGSTPAPCEGSRGHLRDMTANELEHDYRRLRAGDQSVLNDYEDGWTPVRCAVAACLRWTREDRAL